MQIKQRNSRYPSLVCYCSVYLGTPSNTLKARDLRYTVTESVALCTQFKGSLVGHLILETKRVVTIFSMAAFAQ